MKRLICLLLSISLMVLLVGCSSGKKEASKSDSGAANTATLSSKTFKAAMTASPMSLDEGFSNNAQTRQVSIYIFETLFTFDDNYKVIPQLVDTYSVANDGLSATMTLRKGVKFHNGSEFTAKDAVASLERFKTTQLYGKKLDDVKSMEIVNDYEIKFTFSKPIGLPALLAFPQRIYMLPKDIADKNKGTELKGKDLVGTGPYKLIEWNPDVHVKLERFDQYAVDNRYQNATGFGGKRIPYFKNIYLLPVKEAEARMAGLETGEFDFAEAIPNTSHNRIKGNDKLVASIVKPKWSIVVEFNHKNEFIKDKNFLQALVYSLDMEKVLVAVTSNNKDFYRLDPSIYTPEQFYYSEAGSAGIYNKPDLAKVKDLLAKANYKGEEIVYLVNKDYDFMYKACLSLAEQWQAAGINVKLEFSDWPTQISKAKSMKGWAMNQSGLSPRLDPTQLSASLASTSIGGYGYSNPAMDKLLEEISLGKPEDQRKATMEKIQTLIWQDLPFLKIGDSFEMEAINKKYKGFNSFYAARFWNVTE